MALGRRILDRRRVVIAFWQEGTSEALLVDPAVDLDKSDLAAYRKSLWDPGKLVLRDGEQPTWFTIKPLSRRQVRYASTLRHETVEWADFVVRAGLCLVENYQLQKDTGERVQMPTVTVAKEGELGDLITSKWMDEVHLQSDIMTSLAIMIWAISEVHLPLSRPSEPPSGDPQ